MRLLFAEEQSGLRLGVVDQRRKEGKKWIRWGGALALKINLGFVGWGQENGEVELRELKVFARR